MARKKSIVDIQVNDAKYKALLAVHKKFLDSLETMPRGWDKLDKGIAKTGETLRLTTAALLAQQAAFRAEDKEDKRKQNESLKKAREARTEKSQADRIEREATKKVEKEEKEHQKQTLVAEKARRASTKAVLNDVKSIGKTIANTTIDLFKWVGVGEVIGGLLGFGAIWGVSDLAGRATDMRRAALALGTTPAGQEAANVFLSPFMDVNSALSGIAGAQANMSSYWAQNATGVPFVGMDPTEALLKLLPSAWNKVNQPGFNLVEQNPTVMAFEAAGLSIDTLRSLRTMLKQGMSFKEFSEILTNTKLAMKSLAEQLGPSKLMAWTGLQVSLHQAKLNIEAALIDKLSPLAPIIGNLGVTISNVITKFMDSKQLGQWITQFGSAVQYWGDWLSKPTNQQALQKGFNDFLVDLNNLGIAINKVSNFIAGPPSTTGPGGKQPAGDDLWGNYVAGMRVWGKWLGIGGSGGSSGAGAGGHGMHLGLQLGMANALVGILKNKGISDAVAKGIAAGAFGEGGFTVPNSFSSGGAFGVLQARGPVLRGLFNEYGPHPSLYQQAMYLIELLHGKDRGGPSVLAAKTAQDALKAYATNLMRPDLPGHGHANAIGDINRGLGILSQLNGRAVSLRTPAVTVNTHLHVSAPAGSQVAVQGAQLSGATNRG